MDRSQAQIAVDVFDTSAPVIDLSTVSLLISLAFGNNWEMFYWDISVAFTLECMSYFLDRLVSRFHAGTCARVKRNLYGCNQHPSHGMMVYINL